MDNGGRSSRQRFIQLPTYCLPVLCCGMYQNSFAPVNDTYKNMFGDTDMQVAMFSMIIPICSVLLSWFTPATYSRFGYRNGCLLYTSDAADEEDSVDLGGRRIIKKKKKKNILVYRPSREKTQLYKVRHIESEVVYLR
eukprot:TRINITY_DN11094_c0_g1_i4.p1 TRINITY_DN11094_c0_g1~~TRINITY_DN11094_c0_g1_i4.p1  ORF type:complete len:138 (-),score=22.00 TRINITY_DN11094_c0_g1_i4:12-425(-)